MNTLTEEQVATFRRNGFLFPFPMLGKDETQTCLAALDKVRRKLRRDGTFAGQRDFLSNSHSNQQLVSVVCESDARTGEQPPAVGRVKTD
jgi:hypothetical protein